MKATDYVLIGDGLVPVAEACVPVRDRGFLFGDAVYETLRAYEGRPFLLEEHLNRLRFSAASLYMDLPWSNAELARRLERLLRANGIDSGRIRIMVTRGDGDVRARPDQTGPPRLVISAEALPPSGPPQGAVSVEISRRIRNLPDALDPAIKSANLLNNLLARFEMRDPSSFEVLLPNQLGDLTEGSLSNLFLVDAAGVLKTPALKSGLLAGITRKLVIELAEDSGLMTEECRVAPELLMAAREAFLTASTIEILAISRVDGQPFSEAAPGSVTRGLQERYQERVRAYARGAPGFE